MKRTDDRSRPTPPPSWEPVYTAAPHRRPHEHPSFGVADLAAPTERHRAGLRFDQRAAARTGPRGWTP
ncbi:hypothetical protein [Nocardiopsis eucommiae]|uniref:hypothetical protein n=1 Tax=Nocardiopsis eucommiae TaxID=2831970 RepID=UPI003D75DF7F